VGQDNYRHDLQERSHTFVGNLKIIMSHPREDVQIRRRTGRRSTRSQLRWRGQPPCARQPLEVIENSLCATRPFSPERMNCK
jgi:hypothetical protein